MVHWDLPRTPASTLLLTRLAAEHGVPAATCLRDTGLGPGQLHDPDAEISARQELTVIANLLHALGSPPGLGLHAGIRYRLTAYGIWGFALLSSPTLRGAIDVGLRYVDLTFAFCRIQAREQDDEMQLVLDTPDIPLALRRFVVERDAAAIQTIQRPVCLPRPGPPDQLRLRATARRHRSKRGDLRHHRGLRCPGEHRGLRVRALGPPPAAGQRAHRRPGAGPVPGPAGPTPR